MTLSHITDASLYIFTLLIDKIQLILLSSLNRIFHYDFSNFIRKRSDSIQENKDYEICVKTVIRTTIKSTSFTDATIIVNRHCIYGNTVCSRQTQNSIGLVYQYNLFNENCIVIFIEISGILGCP